MSVTRYSIILSLAILGQVAVSADQGAVVTGDRVNVRSDISGAAGNEYFFHNFTD